MKREMIVELVRKIYGSEMYYSKNPAGWDCRYKAYNYFLSWSNTNEIYKAFKTQKELIAFLEDELINK